MRISTGGGKAGKMIVNLFMVFFCFVTCIYAQGQIIEKADEKSFAEDRISGDFTKNFMQSGESEQVKLIGRLTPEARKELFISLKEHYTSAGDSMSKMMCINALQVLSYGLIADMEPNNNIYDLIKNVLVFMNNNIKYQSDVSFLEQRDCCQWTGGQVLAEGNFNGCVEAAKLFLDLFKGAAQRKRLEYGSCGYVSSFPVNWAKIRAQESNFGREGIPGHALIEIEPLNGKRLLVDAAMFPDVEAGEVSSIIKYADENDIYYKDTDEGPNQPYKLFGRGVMYSAHDGTDGSDEATKRAVIKWLELENLR